ncbi:MAG: molybdate ABC transporter substrate-binding protein [Armatimonadetes bacterium]|nr:molybdate ABC transporter substrate-binding protein [Armatimonadota bacterium]
MRRWIVIALLLGAVMPAQAQPQQKGTLHLFIPCGMILPFNHAKADFEARTGMKLKITYDNAVALMRRIRDKGERPDIFIAPGELELRQLAAEGYVDPASIVTFGTFKMVLVVPKRNRAGVKSFADLAKPQVRRVAIADPELNSVGHYAREALKGLKLWDKVEGKVLTHWHALEAVHYVCNGRVDAGVYYATCPLESAPEKVGNATYRILAEVPRNLYPPVKVQGGVLKEAKNQAAAQQFLAFLKEPATQRKLSQFGIPNYSELHRGKP